MSEHKQLARHNRWLMIGVRGRWVDLGNSISGNSPEDYGEFVGYTPSGNVKIKPFSYIATDKKTLYFKEVRR